MSSMTDAELRQELISFAYDVPISTNREFLLNLVEKIRKGEEVHIPEEGKGYCFWTTMKKCFIPVVTDGSVIIVLFLGLQFLLHKNFCMEMIYKATIFDWVKVLSLTVIGLSGGLLVSEVMTRIQDYFLQWKSKAELVKEIGQRLREQREASLKSDGSIPNYLVVNHLRDELLNPRERTTATKLALWTKVVDYIKVNESRVGEEIKQVDGVEVQVWTWLPVPAATATAHSKPE